MRRFFFLLATCTAACPPPTAPERATPSVAHLPRPGAAWPASAPACVIVQAAPSAANCSYLATDLARTKGGAPFARFESTYDRGTIAWSELPRLGDASAQDRARVDATDGGLHLYGYASLEAQRFSLRQRAEVVADHLWVEPDRPVRILGTTGDRVAIAVDTPFLEPRIYEASVPCDVFHAERGDGGHPAAPVEPPYARVTARSITFRAAPNGPALLTATPDPRGVLAWRGARDGFVHVATLDAEGGALAFDAWVDADDVARVQRHDFDRDFGDCADSTDACIADRTARETRVFVGTAGPEGEAVGTLDAGTPLILEPRDPRGSEPFVRFVTQERILTATRGNALWVARADLSRDEACAP